MEIPPSCMRSYEQGRRRKVSTSYQQAAESHCKFSNNCVNMVSFIYFQDICLHTSLKILVQICAYILLLGWHVSIEIWNNHYYIKSKVF